MAKVAVTDENSFDDSTLDDALTLDALKTKDNAIVNDRGSVIGHKNAVSIGRDIMQLKMPSISTPQKTDTKPRDNDEGSWDESVTGSESDEGSENPIKSAGNNLGQQGATATRPDLLLSHDDNDFDDEDAHLTDEDDEFDTELSFPLSASENSRNAPVVSTKREDTERLFKEQDALKKKAEDEKLRLEAAAKREHEEKQRQAEAAAKREQEEKQRQAEAAAKREQEEKQRQAEVLRQKLAEDSLRRKAEAEARQKDLEKQLQLMNDAENARLDKARIEREEAMQRAATSQKLLRDVSCLREINTTYICRLSYLGSPKRPQGKRN